MRALAARICLAAIISTRSPMLLMYSTPEKSSTSGVLPAAASSTIGASAACSCCALG